MASNRRWCLPFRYRGSRRESAVAQLFSLGIIRAMKRFIILSLALPILAYGCCTDHHAQKHDKSWASLPRLESIAKDYAKQHEIDFDFTNARPELTFDDQKPNLAWVCFYHGKHDTFLEVTIDRSGTVVFASPVEPPP